MPLLLQAVGVSSFQETAVVSHLSARLFVGITELYNKMVKLFVVVMFVMLFFQEKFWAVETRRKFERIWVPAQNWLPSKAIGSSRAR